MPDELADTRRGFASGELVASEFHAVFLTSRVFFLTGDRPGLVAFGDPGAGVVSVFSSLSELARFVVAQPEMATRETRWASTVGAEILQLVPPGYEITLDPASSDPVTIPKDARRAKTVLTARRRDT